MNSQKNNAAESSSSHGKAAVEGECISDLLPRPLEIQKNAVDIDESRNVLRLTADQFEFLGMVADTVQCAAMRSNLNGTPRQRDVTKSNEITISKLSGGDAEGIQQLSVDCVKPKRQPVLQLQLAKMRNRNAKSATVEFSEVLEKALRAAAVSRSLNHVIPVNFPRRIGNINVIGQRSFGDVAIKVHSAPGFRRSFVSEIVPDMHQLQSTDCAAQITATPDILPAVMHHAVIGSRQTNDDIVTEENVEDEQPEAATAVRRRRPILSALGRRLLKVGRLLCCWCRTAPSEDTE